MLLFTLNGFRSRPGTEKVGEKTTNTAGPETQQQNYNLEGPKLDKMSNFSGVFTADFLQIFEKLKIEMIKMIDMHL